MNCDNFYQNFDLDNDLDSNSNDGYESNDEIKIEITDSKNGSQYTQIYSIPFRPTHCNEKRLICYSKINGEQCNYGNNCTYAHSLDEQVIDSDKKYIYQIILDVDLMNFYSLTNPKTEHIYKQLLLMTYVCENCLHKKCTGGYNCRNGVNSSSLKLCKNDLLTGECLNKIIEINVDNQIISKIKSDNFNCAEKYLGCINGHHLTNRNLVPYYKYVHFKENSKKNKYHSVRYIDINPLNKLFKDNYNKDDTPSSFNEFDKQESDSSTDEEINSWFQSMKHIDSDSDSETDDFKKIFQSTQLQFQIYKINKLINIIILFINTK